MTSNVYHVHFLDHQLPEDGAEKARFAREYAAELTGVPTAGVQQDEIICFIQSHTQDPSCRVTISVPQRLTEAVRRIEESGLEPVFTEPEKPRLEGDTCVLPGSFQIRHFGVVLNPQSVSNHPVRQDIIAKTLAAHVPDLPEIAKDFLNWTWIDADEETGAAVISWEREEDD